MSELVTEKALTEAAAAGDVHALEQLLWMHMDSLERHMEMRIPADARRHIGAEDITQEVLTQAFRDIGQFQTRDDASFLAWLKAIGENRLADALKHIGRKKRGGDRHRLSSGDIAKCSTFATLLDLLGHDSHLPDDSAARREAERALQVALASLPDLERQVICARYLDDKSVNEIARETGRTAPAVRGLIQRGKARLEDAMGRSSLWLKSR